VSYSAGSEFTFTNAQNIPAGIRNPISIGTDWMK